MNAVIYARYSSDSQREESIDGQIRECTEYAGRNNITISNCYIDRALSARTADRPEFQRMIRDSEKGLFDTVIVWKLDRFSRDRYDSAFYKRILKKNGVKVVSAKENISEGPEGIILESMLEGYAEYYSAELAEKVKRGQKENAMKGKNNGGRTPFGYRVNPETHKLEVEPFEAMIVRDIFNRYEKGEPIKEIVRSINRSGMLGAKGKLSYHIACNIVRNRKYIGEYRYRDVVIANGVPAIVSKDVFDRVQLRIQGNKKAPAHTKAEDQYLLCTKLFCGDCGAMMVGESGRSRAGKVYRYYKCGNAKRKHGCKRKAIKKDWIESVVVRVTAAEVLNDEAIERIACAIMELQGKEDRAIPTLQRELKECEKGIDNLVNAIQAGLFSESMRDRMNELEEQRKQLSEQIQELRMAQPVYTKEEIVGWINRFKEGNLEDAEFRRELIDTFVNSVYVYDRKLIFTYNFRDGVKTLSLDEIEKYFGSDLRPSCPPISKSKDFGIFLFLWVKSLV